VVSPCRDTCLSKYASASCESEPAPGCACPAGQVWSGNLCVNTTDCGCEFTDGRRTQYFPVSAAQGSPTAC